MFIFFSLYQKKTNCFSFILSETILNSAVYLGIFFTPAELLSLIVTDSPSTVTDQKKR